jgi:hypothetical protein
MMKPTRVAPPSDDELNLIQDPETGLALLAKYSWPPEREPQRRFWQAQFTHWQEWRAGDAQAVGHAVTSCAFHKRRPPLWLCYASIELGERCRSDAEKREHRDLTEHVLRWKAVELVRGRRPWDPRNYERKVPSDAVFEEAAKLVAGTAAEAGADMVKKSHALVRRAGGPLVTLANYRREVEVRERQRREKRARERRHKNKSG